MGGGGNGRGNSMGGMGGIFGSAVNSFANYAQNVEEQQMRQAMEASLREAEQQTSSNKTETDVLNGLKESCLDMDDLSNGNDSCTICFEKQNVGDLAIKLKCGHCFHKECVWPWLTKNSTCPVCRLDINVNNKRKAMGRREEMMRKQHLNNIEMRRRQHTQSVAESRKRMQKMEEEERKTTAKVPIVNNNETKSGSEIKERARRS